MKYRREEKKKRNGIAGVNILNHETSIFLALFLVQLGGYLYAAWREKSAEFGKYAVVLIPLTLISYWLAYKMKANIYLIVWTTLLLNVGFLIQCVANQKIEERDVVKLVVAFVVAFVATLLFRIFSDYFSMDKSLVLLIIMQVVLLLFLAVFGETVAVGEQAAKIQLQIGRLISIQPFEIVKVVYVFVMSILLCKDELKDKSVLKVGREMVAAIYTLCTVGSIIVFGEGGTALVILITGIILIITFSDKRRVVAMFVKISAVMVVLVTVACVLLRDYIGFFNKVYQRLNFFFVPDIGYQSSQLRKGLALGGLFGPVTERYMVYIPSQSEDMIFGKLVSCTGIVVGIVVLGAIFLMFREGYAIALQCKDSFYKGLTISFSLLIMVGSLIHIMVNLCLFPITGLPLVFVSNGLTNMTCGLTMVGFMLVISRGTQERSVYNEENVDRFFGKKWKFRRRRSQRTDRGKAQ